MIKSIIILLCVVMIGGCAAQTHTANRGPSTQESQDDRGILQVDRKVVLSGQVTLGVESPDSIHGLMIKLAETHGGYLLSSQEDHITIRIPAEGLYDALSTVETWGEVIDRRILGQEVTEEYYDLEIRLKNAEATRDRYLDLLEHASSIDEMLKLERELERLSQQIDVLRGKLNRLVHQVAYCTITVEAVTLGGKPGPVAALFKGVYSGARWLFVRD
jgi:hypothetical protein